MKDHYDKPINIGSVISYSDHGLTMYGTVERDDAYRGGMRVGGRSVADILDHCDKVLVLS